jgi:hypothetical protein
LRNVLRFSCQRKSMNDFIFAKTELPKHAELFLRVRRPRRDALAQLLNRRRSRLEQGSLP